MRIVDTRDGSFVDVTHDRAIDGDPSYSADGRWLYFHSDRTGVSNIYAYEVATRRLKQVTNVINGAYQPEPSPDGKSLAYVGYTHEGYDMFVMPLDESQWLDAAALRGDAPGAARRAAAGVGHAERVQPAAHAPAARLLGEDHARELRRGDHRHRLRERHRGHPRDHARA